MSAASSSSARPASAARPMRAARSSMEDEHSSSGESVDTDRFRRAAPRKESGKELATMHSGNTLASIGHGVISKQIESANFIVRDDDGKRRGISVNSTDLDDDKQIEEFRRTNRVSRRLMEEGPRQQIRAIEDLAKAVPLLGLSHYFGSSVKVMHERLARMADLESSDESNAQAFKTLQTLLKRHTDVWMEFIDEFDFALTTMHSDFKDVHGEPFFEEAFAKLFEIKERLAKMSYDGDESPLFKRMKMREDGGSKTITELQFLKNHMNEIREAHVVTKSEKARQARQAQEQADAERRRMAEELESSSSQLRSYEILEARRQEQQEKDAARQKKQEEDATRQKQEERDAHYARLVAKEEEETAQKEAQKEAKKASQKASQKAREIKDKEILRKAKDLMKSGRFGSEDDESAAASASPARGRRPPMLRGESASATSRRPSGGEDEYDTEPSGFLGRGLSMAKGAAAIAAHVAEDLGHRAARALSLEDNRRKESKEEDAEEDA